MSAGLTGDVLRGLWPTGGGFRLAQFALIPEAIRIDGRVDDLIEVGGVRIVRGWAIDTTVLAYPAEVTVWLDGQYLATVLCDRTRPDLLAADMPQEAGGFEWELPDGLVLGAHNRLIFRVGEMTLPFYNPATSMDQLWVEPMTPERHEVPEFVGLTRDDAWPDEPESSLFSASHYQSVGPDLSDLDQTPWQHFLAEGARKGRNPSLLFDMTFYRQANPGLAADENPLLHFERIGRAAGWRHHWLFTEAEYLRLNADLPEGSDGLRHALDHGLRENRMVHALFDPVYYLSRYPDVASAGMSAIEHFLKSGDRELRSPHPLFDSHYYARQVGDLGGKGALEHYTLFRTKARPHPLFDPGFYVDSYADARDSSVTPLYHYITVGAARGYVPHRAFDTAHYLASSPEPDAKANPLLHYVLTGSRAGRTPHALFDPRYYVTQPRRRVMSGTSLPTTGPRISVIVPVYNTPGKVLAECIQSVLDQSYTSWELCIVDDGSSAPDTSTTLAAYHGRDPRIRIDRAVSNLHIARATNRAAMQATGEFLAFLDHDDVLEPEALAEIAAAIMRDPEIDVLYTDEDKINLDGDRFESYYKPDWSPEHLHSVMYMLHMFVVRKSLFWAVGGSRPERTGAQDYDLALRTTRLARRVHHVPAILYHWRVLSGSVAGDTEAKPYALAAARAALEDFATASGAEARVEDGLLKGTFRVRPSLASSPDVSLLIFTNDGEREIPGRGRVNLVRNFLSSIAAKTSYSNYRIVIVDNANSSPETLALAAELGATVLPYRDTGPFNYAHKANFATEATTTEHLIYLNDDLEVITPDWIEALLELSTDPGIGGVGCRLLYANGHIQHSGVVLGLAGATGHAFWGLDRDTVGYNAYTHVIRNYSAVTGAVFATRRSVMSEVGGFDESLTVDYNDVDLCLRIGRKGLRIAFTPFCELYHFEGSTAIRTEQNPAERAIFVDRWGYLIERDPYYNPNLPRDRLGFA